MGLRDFLDFDPRSLTRGCVFFGPCAVTTLKSLDFYLPPGVRSPAGPAIRAGADGPAKPELLGRACLVAVGAEAADIAVIVGATLGQRHDVVGHRGFPNDASACAVPAERFSLQAPQPLSDCAASPLPFSHAQPSNETRPEAGGGSGRGSQLSNSECLEECQISVNPKSYIISI